MVTGGLLLKPEYLQLSAKQYCEQKNHTEKECLDVMLNKTVFVNAISSNHFREAHNLFGSIQQKMPGAKLLIYDIGLTETQRAALRKICNVELRTFNFSKYPDHVHPKALGNYAWKPLIINEVAQEYEIIMYTDSSIRFIASLKEHVFPYFLSTNLTLLGLPFFGGSNIVQYTHNDTLLYFNLRREELTYLRQIQFGFAVFWMSNDIVRSILAVWVDCAMHENCIAPKGTLEHHPGCKKLGGPRATVYCGCHRFDQSAIDLILYKRYGKGLHALFEPIASSTCKAQRRYK